jgi:hypothetical protein
MISFLITFENLNKRLCKIKQQVTTEMAKVLKIKHPNIIKETKDQG